MNKIQILQNKAIKVFSSFPLYTKHIDIYNSYKILRIEDIHKLQTSIFIFNFINNNLPNLFYINKYFQINKQCHAFNTETKIS